MRAVYGERLSGSDAAHSVVLAIKGVIKIVYLPVACEGKQIKANV